MNPGTLSISHPVRRLALIVAMVVLAWSVALLSGSVASGDPVAIPTQPDQLLSPFRWSPVSARLA